MYAGDSTPTTPAYLPIEQPFVVQITSESSGWTGYYNWHEVSMGPTGAFASGISPRYGSGTLQEINSQDISGSLPVYARIWSEGMTANNPVSGPSPMYFFQAGTTTVSSGPTAHTTVKVTAAPSSGSYWWAGTAYTPPTVSYSGGQITYTGGSACWAVDRNSSSNTSGLVIGTYYDADLVTVTGGPPSGVIQLPVYAVQAIGSSTSGSSTDSGISLSVAVIQSIVCQSGSLVTSGITLHFTTGDLTSGG